VRGEVGTAGRRTAAWVCRALGELCAHHWEAADVEEVPSPVASEGASRANRNRFGTPSPCRC
jgi:hypothetical protein